MDAVVKPGHDRHFFECRHGTARFGEGDVLFLDVAETSTIFFGRCNQEENRTSLVRVADSLDG